MLNQVVPALSTNCPVSARTLADQGRITTKTGEPAGNEYGGGDTDLTRQRSQAEAEAGRDELPVGRLLAVSEHERECREGECQIEGFRPEGVTEADENRIERCDRCGYQADALASEGASDQEQERYANHIERHVGRTCHLEGDAEGAVEARVHQDRAGWPAVCVAQRESLGQLARQSVVVQLVVHQTRRRRRDEGNDTYDQCQCEDRAKTLDRRAPRTSDRLCGGAVHETLASWVRGSACIRG
jgi:hypothetical protein